MGKYIKTLQAYLILSLMLVTPKPYSMEFTKVPVYYEPLCFDKVTNEKYFYSQYKDVSTFIMHSKYHAFVVFNVGHCWSS